MRLAGLWLKTMWQQQPGVDESGPMPHVGAKVLAADPYFEVWTSSREQPPLECVCLSQTHTHTRCGRHNQQAPAADPKLLPIA
jgi:hypothetical protein